MSQEILKKLEELQVGQRSFEAQITSRLDGMATRLDEVERGLRDEIRNGLHELRDNELTTLLEAVRLVGQKANNNKTGIEQLAGMLKYLGERTESRLKAVGG